MPPFETYEKIINLEIVFCTFIVVMSRSVFDVTRVNYNSFKKVAMRLPEMSNMPLIVTELLKPRLRDKTCCQTGLTTGCIV